MKKKDVYVCFSHVCTMSRLSDPVVKFNFLLHKKRKIGGVTRHVVSSEFLKSHFFHSPYSPFPSYDDLDSDTAAELKAIKKCTTVFDGFSISKPSYIFDEAYSGILSKRNGRVIFDNTTDYDGFVPVKKGVVWIDGKTYSKINIEISFYDLAIQANINISKLYDYYASQKYDHSECINKVAFAVRDLKEALCNPLPSCIVGEGGNGCIICQQANVSVKNKNIVLAGYKRPITEVKARDFFDFCEEIEAPLKKYIHNPIDMNQTCWSLKAVQELLG